MKNFVKFAGIAALVVIFVLLSACASSSRGSSSNNIIFADFIGFSDDVTTNYKFYDLTRRRHEDNMKKAIAELKSGSGTAAYYAMDIALDRIEKVKGDKNFNQDTRFYVIFFTDGLDNASTALARRSRRGNFNSDDDYAKALQGRMEKILNRGRRENTTNSFQSYSLLYKGGDIEASGWSDADLMNKMQQFTGAQNAEVPEPIIDNNFDKMFAEFKNKFIISSLSFEIPEGYAGKRIRMQLNKTTVEEDKIYFEADFVRKRNNVYTLENISGSRGRGGASGFELASKDGIIQMDESYDRKSNTVPFKVMELKNNGNPYPVVRENVSQWYYDGGLPRLNSEYSSASQSVKNAYILLVLDTSKSLGNQVGKAKEMAINIVQYIKGND